MTHYKYFTNSDGLRLAYQLDGKGPPLICLAGLTRNSTDFDYLRRHLSGVTFICPDYRGRGESDWDSNPDNYNAAREAQDVVELLDHLDIGSAPVLGTSRGGIIAMILAASTSGRIPAIILNDIGPEIDAIGLNRIAGHVGHRPHVRSFDEAARLLPLNLIGFEDVSHSRWLEDVQKNYIECSDRLQLRYDPNLRKQFLEAVRSEQLDLWELFDRVPDIPLLLLRGEGSDLLSESTALQMCGKRPRMVYCTVPGRGHCPFLDEPECLRAITIFLADLGCSFELIEQD